MSVHQQPAPCFVCEARIAPFLFAGPGAQGGVAVCLDHRLDGKRWLADAIAATGAAHPAPADQGKLL